MCYLSQHLVQQCFISSIFVDLAKLNDPVSKNAFLIVVRKFVEQAET